MRTRVALLFFLLLTGCSKRDGRPTVRLAVGGASQFVYLPTTLAQQLGYYQHEGLDVTLQDFQGGAKSLEALLGGSVDVVSGFYDHVIQMDSEGRHLKSFVTMVRYPGLLLVASPAGRKKISAIADLKGATVGVTALGSSTHLLLNYLLSRHGMTAQDVSATAIGSGASAIAAMEHGTVDAAIMTDPAFSRLVNRNAKRNAKTAVLVDLRQPLAIRELLGVDTYPASVFYSTEEWIAKNPDTARRLTAAMKRTLTWIQQHRPEEIMNTMPPAFRGDDPGLYLAALRLAAPMYSPDGAMPPDGAAAVQRVLSVSMQKVRDAKIDLSTTYTNDLR